MLDLPLPFRPVIALNCWSKPCTTVRLAYDLKPRTRAEGVRQRPLFVRACFQILLCFVLFPVTPP